MVITEYKTNTLSLFHISVCIMWRKYQPVFMFDDKLYSQKIWVSQIFTLDVKVSQNFIQVLENFM